MATSVLAAQQTEWTLWTAETFLGWLRPKVHADLIDGEKYMHSPVNFRHASLLNFLHPLLTLYVERNKLGRVDRENIAVRLSSRNVFMPDICYFTKQQVARLRPTYAPFAPTLVIEVLSPGTEERDTTWKFAAYEEHGAQEYWVLDPETLGHRFFARQGELLVEFAQGATLVRSRTVPGFWVRRVWLNPDSIPAIASSFRQLTATRRKRSGATPCGSALDS